MMRNLIGKRKIAFLNSSPGPFSYKEKGSVWESIPLGKVPLFLREGFRVSSFYTTLLLLTIILFTGCGSNDNPAPKDEKKEQAKLVKVIEVQPTILQEVLEITGTTEPLNTANIISNTEGKVTKLNVREADFVREGQVVVRFSPMLREDVITAARIKVESLEEELKQNPQDENIIKQLSEAKENYQFALEQYKEVSIVSPVNGIVSKRFVDIGDMVAAKTKLFEVTSSNNFKVNLTVAEPDIRKLQVGQKANLNLDACPDRKFTGTITRIYPEIDPLTRNGIVELRLDNPCPNTKSGMFVRASFITKTLKNILAVPLYSIVNKADKKLVFVVDENMTAKSVEVKTGFKTKKEVEIIQGLEIGSKVVVEGQETLKNNDKVKISPKESFGQQNNKEAKK